VLDASVEFTEQPFVTPLQLSSGAITVITEARVTVAVRVRSTAGDGPREASGRGSIYLSDLWAWPDAPLAHQARDAVLRTVCERIATGLVELCGEPAHPLELGMRLHEGVCAGVVSGAGAPSLPPLALAMCASPFDAAVHDAAGHALGQSAFRFYEDASEMPAVDPFFGGPGSAGEAVRALLRPAPVAAFPAWCVVNKSDALDTAVRPWVVDGGYRCFKLKLMGADNAVDVARTVEVYEGLCAMGVERPRLTIDSNEANPDSASVVDYFERLRGASPDAFEALEYAEQPTNRDIAAHPQDWTRATAMKPVLLDEGLTSLDRLDTARQQGWGGLALKTCKGHSFLLAAAAWAHQRGWPLALQDLTNPGYAAIHAALTAAWVPTVNGVELNAAQFTPAANAPWLPRLAALLEPRDGVHRLPETSPPGLGSGL
jgi:L-alanine-DL-glutamate epimerase-like enolase superfamily enzyme